MTTAAPHHHEETLQQIDELVHAAWLQYSEALRDLKGAEYDTTEAESWDRLQQELADLEGQRAQITGPVSTDAA